MDNERLYIPVSPFGRQFWPFRCWRYQNMIVIRCNGSDSKRRALGFLAGRFSFKSWSTGEMAVPEAALAHLATEGIAFAVEGPATYERLISAVRDLTPSPV